MLKQRLITAIILIAVVCWLVLRASPLVCGVSFAALVTLGAWEWSQLIPLRHQLGRYLYSGLLLLIVVIFYIKIANLHAYIMLSQLALLLLASACLAEITYPQSRVVWALPVTIGIAGVVLLSSSWWSLMHLKMAPNGMEYLLYLLLLIWAADSGAYFAGKLWGKHKLLPQVSPGKTFEGLLGGILLSLLVMIIAGYCFKIAANLWGTWLLLGMVTVLSTVIGDLLVSMLKRNVNLKDTGSILPGHGGILDRIDSLLAAGVVFSYLALRLGFMQS